MWTLVAVFSLAMRACLVVSVSLGPSVVLPRLAPWVTLAVRADARDVIYLSSNTAIRTTLFCRVLPQFLLTLF